MVNVAVIPAKRGDAKMENKNLYSLDGKPLIRWITQTVVNSNLFDIVIISTDTDHIYHAVSDFRIQRVQNNHKNDIDNVLSIASTFDIEPGDLFAYFSPMYPFINEKDIQSAFNIFMKENVDSVVGVTKIKIQTACLISPDNYLLPILDLSTDKLYYKFCSFAIMNGNSFLRNKKFIMPKTKCVIISDERSVEVNSIQDILYAESIVSGKSKSR